MQKKSKILMYFIVNFFLLFIPVNHSVATTKLNKKVTVESESNDMLAAADVNEGQKISLGCTACHSIKKGEPNKVGPNLFGIVGAKRARRKDYEYSDALKKLRGSRWTVDELYKWLRDPQEYAPGTKMSFFGILDPQDRLDLIAYLKTLK